jgi:hypothetical protein
LDLAETMLEKQKKLFNEHGEVNKEALVEFYKELRKFPDISDSDAAVLAATKYKIHTAIIFISNPMGSTHFLMNFQTH